MTDVEWGSQERHWIDRLGASASTLITCFTHYELDRISADFRLPREKFCFVPLAFVPQDVFEASDEGYIIAGGTKFRDWKTLVDAVDGLPYRVRIFTRDKLPRAPGNVTVEWADRAGYYRRIAAASCVVIPALPQPWQTPGNTSWVSAMAMGKVAITTDPQGAPDYMEQGVSGFYVPNGDAAALRQVIQLVMQDGALRQRVGKAARERAWRDFESQRLPAADPGIA